MLVSHGLTLTALRVLSGHHKSTHHFSRLDALCQNHAVWLSLMLLHDDHPSCYESFSMLFVEYFFSSTLNCVSFSLFVSLPTNCEIDFITGLLFNMIWKLYFCHNIVPFFHVHMTLDCNHLKNVICQCHSLVGLVSVLLGIKGGGGDDEETTKRFLKNRKHDFSTYHLYGLKIACRTITPKGTCFPRFYHMFMHSCYGIYLSLSQRLTKVTFLIT